MSMKKTVIVYGSSTGTCEDLAQRIAKQLGIDKSNVIDATSLTSDIISTSDNLILGTSTWGDGEMQDDWYGALDILKECNLSGKNIALFGCGDSQSYSDTFCNGMAQLWKELQNKGANIIGGVSTLGYTFDDSEAAIDGKFVGLALDDVNEPDKTDERITLWISSCLLGALA